MRDTVYFTLPKAWNIRVSRFSFNLSFYKSNFLFLYILRGLNNIYYIIA